MSPEVKRDVTLDRDAGQGRKLEVVRRNDHYDMESLMHGDEHSWAVSYADLLMVLLSFFVIFFSVESSKNKDALIYKILADVKGTSAGMGPGGRQVDSLNGRQFTETDAHKLAEMFHSLNPVVGNNPASLTLEFPENIFPSGSYKLKGQYLTEFRQLFTTLKPYDKMLEVTIIGHSDSRLVASVDGRKYEDNFELSSLRASASIREAVALGFNEANIRGQASSHNQRDTRSISVTIRDLSD